MMREISHYFRLNIDIVWSFPQSISFLFCENLIYLVYIHFVDNRLQSTSTSVINSYFLNIDILCIIDKEPNPCLQKQISWQKQ